jgi:hypothetical protein
MVGVALVSESSTGGRSLRLDLLAGLCASTLSGPRSRQFQGARYVDFLAEAATTAQY